MSIVWSPVQRMSDPSVATLAGALDWRISIAAWNERCWLRLSFQQR